MSGYREITVPGEARAVRRPAPRRAAAPSDWRGVLVGAVKATGASCRNSPGTVLSSVVAVGAAGFICFNALGHQSGRHPAPILPKVATQKAPAPREPAAAAKEAIRDVVKEPTQPDRAAAPAKQAARDPIADLIRSDETTASVTPRAVAVRTTAKPVQKDAPKEAAKTAKPEAQPDPVLRAQKALSKLGYPVKPDGAMGPGTRAAIEKFERSAKLPVTGEAAGRTLRALMSRAGQG
ncbi:peptidoglycan-binding domain-containing protein [Methylobacterium sp. E-066]|uniref:peptidoglycan-binding domain-containing protein n=1 Tax=Methylobacterium sp. E-066 TaxID=2836584 RepID=UPI001FBA964C|nr:peptidoglycan-binding domain-containing protein [Methylobacterium sp. E-066]MCJ2143855.1 peptidoglycan-binding protein [Methylobacterium sp. E-066]